MKNKKIVLLILLLGVSISLFSCGMKKERSINDTWKVIEAVPEDKKSIGYMLGEDNGTIFFENDKYLNEYEMTQDYDEYLKHYGRKREEMKTLEQFNQAMRKVGYKADNMDNFYVLFDPDEIEQICFVMVDDGKKLVSLIPSNQWDDEENYSAVLFERMSLKK
ncbi:hypothetical protein [Vagococcus fluvialis]|uniref:Uncharacterized protein n=1 Tax=Vagococcus fluvialis TaxID=2738 RepID=A0A7X6I349_9ENTE|nr:hypothetical protein [Vagococcus fluvialis]NKC68198.1 hypothetical protein [Vagococcus fluvialis]